MLPSEDPKQVAFVTELVAVIALGCVIVATCVVVHPFASVTVQVYDPTPRPFAVAPFPPDGDHE